MKDSKLEAIVQESLSGRGDGRISKDDLARITDHLQESGKLNSDSIQYLNQNYETKLTAAASEQLNATASDIAGLSHLGKGFDYIKMGSFNLTMSGQEKPYAILKTGTGSLPKYVKKIEHNTGGAQKGSSTIKSVVDYSNAHSEHAKVKGGFPGVIQGSASIAFDAYKQTTSSVESYYSYVRTFIYNTEYLLDLKQTIPLGDEFKKSVGELPVIQWSNANSQDKDSYNTFIKRYGTHVATDVIVGGKLFWNKEMSQSTYMSMKSESVDVEAGAEGAFDGFTFGASGGAKTKNSQKFEEATGANKQDIKYVGGDGPPIDGKYSTWESGVRKNPGLVNVTLSGIQNFLTKAYFPSDKTIEKKQLALEAALADYYAANGKVVDLDFPNLKRIHSWMHNLSGTIGAEGSCYGVGDTNKSLKGIVNDYKTWVQNESDAYLVSALGYALPKSMTPPEGASPLKVAKKKAYCYDLVAEASKAANQKIIGYANGTVPIYTLYNTANNHLTIGYTLCPNSSRITPNNTVGHVIAYVKGVNPFAGPEAYYPKTPISYGTKVAIRQKNPTYKGLAPYLTGIAKDSVGTDEFWISHGETWTICNQNDPNDTGVVKYGDTVTLKSHYGNNYLGVNGKSVVNTSSSGTGKNEGWLLDSRASGTDINFIYDSFHLVCNGSTMIANNGSAELGNDDTQSEWLFIPVPTKG